ncbi:MAG: hypothetical protein GY926_09200 [bacterium]|nr:hypothetical protein [bacterium]
MIGEAMTTAEAITKHAAETLGAVAKDLASGEDVDLQKILDRLAPQWPERRR